MAPVTYHGKEPADVDRVIMAPICRVCGSRGLLGAWRAGVSEAYQVSETDHEYGTLGIGRLAKHSAAVWQTCEKRLGMVEDQHGERRTLQPHLAFRED